MTAQEKLVDRLVADGIPDAAVNAAIALINAGDTGLINKVITGRLTIVAALELARNPKRKR